jgi:hypothetical protein
MLTWDRNYTKIYDKNLFEMSSAEMENHKS